jgi:hypothetical protein
MSINRALKALAAGLLLTASMVLQPAAAASSYGFTRITQNASQDVGSQLSMAVTELGGNGAIFSFRNNVGIPSAVAQIYFDDSLGLLKSMDLGSSSGAGVSFAQFASPSDLPGGADFAFAADYSFGAKPPPPKMGLSAENEWVSFVGYWATATTSFSSLLDAIAAGNFRAGLHVISIGESGNSDAYISAVPLPAAVWLFGSALLGFITLSNRRRI